MPPRYRRRPVKGEYLLDASGLQVFVSEYFCDVEEISDAGEYTWWVAKQNIITQLIHLQVTN